MTTSLDTSTRRIINEDSLLDWCRDLAKDKTERTRKWAVTVLRQWLRQGPDANFLRVVDTRDISSPLWHILARVCAERGESYPPITWLSWNLFPDWAKTAYTAGQPIWLWVPPQDETIHHLRHRLDYVDAHPPSRVGYQYTMEQVEEGVKVWDEQMARRAQITNLYKDVLEIPCEDLQALGYKLFFLRSEDALKNEGVYMGHCTNSNSFIYFDMSKDLYSIRSAEERTSVWTCEVQHIGLSSYEPRKGSIKEKPFNEPTKYSYLRQVRARFNGVPSDEDHELILNALKKVVPNLFASYSEYCAHINFAAGVAARARSLTSPPGVRPLPVDDMFIQPLRDLYEGPEFLRSVRQQVGRALRESAAREIQLYTPRFGTRLGDHGAWAEYHAARELEQQILEEPFTIRFDHAIPNDRVISVQVRKNRPASGTPAPWRFVVMDSASGFVDYLEPELDVTDVNKLRRKLLDMMPGLSNEGLQPYSYVRDEDEILVPRTKVQRSLFPAPKYKNATWAANPFSQPLLKKGKKQ